MTIRFYLLAALFGGMISPYASAINFLSINTELSQGQKAVTGIATVVGVDAGDGAGDGAANRLDEGGAVDEREIEAYANLIISTKADVVGLTEPAGKRVATQLLAHLGKQWQLIEQKDRNATTGIRVSFVSRLPLVEGSLSNLSDQYGYSRYDKHRAKPDVVLSAGFELEDQRYYVVIAYLTAGEGEYASVRYAQADAVRNVLFSKCRNHYEHCVVMGNMNAEPGSAAVKRIQGVDGMFGDKVALSQASLQQGRGPMHTFFQEGKSGGLQIDLLMSTLQGSASVFQFESAFSRHSAVLLVGREPYEAERPGAKIKRDRKKMVAYYKMQHLQELVEKQKSYIDVLELENTSLRQLR